MSMSTLHLTVVPHTLTLCRMSCAEEIPDWVQRSPFWSVTRSKGELSVICTEGLVPRDVECDRTWRCLKVEGPFDPSSSGILSSLAEPLACAGISILAISTFETDYVLVKEEVLAQAVTVLRQAGHEVRYDVAA